MDRARLHQLDYRLVARERSAGEPHQVFHSHAGGGFESSERDTISVAQVMMAADGHAVAQSAQPQRGLQVMHPLVAIAGIVAVGANRRAVFVTGRAMAIHTSIGSLLATVHESGNAPTCCVRHEIGCRDRAHAWPPSFADIRPICRARPTSLN